MESSEEIGPIDYILVEWPGRRPHGELAPQLVDLVDRGLIRILDLTFIEKDEEGNVAALEIADVGGEVVELAIFEGASSGLIDQSDLDDAADTVTPGSSAGILLFENLWAIDFVEGMRRGGAELVAAGYVPLGDLAASLDVAESLDAG